MNDVFWPSIIDTVYPETYPDPYYPDEYYIDPYQPYTPYPYMPYYVKTKKTTIIIEKDKITIEIEE